MFGKKKKKQNTEEEEQQQQNWRLTSQSLEKKDVKNIVERDSRHMGVSVSSEIPINVMPQLGMTFKDQRSLNKLLTEKQKEDVKNLEKVQQENDIYAIKYSAIRSFIYNALEEHLTADNKILMDIDIRFEDCMPDILKELELNYHVIRYTRSRDVLEIDKNIPLRFAFMMK